MSDRHRHWRNLIAYLLRRYRTRILAGGMATPNVHFKYQADGLRLQRVSYLPYRAQHAELRMLSFATRVSMCALVVMMLEWERDSEDGRGKNHEVPTAFQTNWTLKAATLTIFARISPWPTHHPP